MPFDPLSGFRARGISKIAFVLLATTAFASCGKLGDKNAANRSLPQTNACLDSIGDRIDRYFDGEIEESEWVATFDCVADQVAFFSRYVRGESPDGYTERDIDAMVRKFLITDSALSTRFVPALFEFKASLFGGTSKIVTKDELNKFLSFNQVVRDETKALLPFLVARAKFPSESNTLRFMDALSTFGENLGKYFSAARGDYSVSKDSFIPFVREVLRLSHGDQSYVDKYGDVGRHLKAVIGGGKSDFIESATWPKLLQEGAALGSVLLGFRDIDKKLVFPSVADEYAFQTIIVKKAHDIVQRILTTTAGGAVPLSMIEPIIDSLPIADFTKEQREAIKTDLPNILSHTLKGGAKGYLTPQAIRTGMDLYESGMQAQIHLNRIFRDLPGTVVPKEFEVAAERYKTTLTASTPDRLVVERKRIDDLVSIAKTFNGLFPQGAGEMKFSLDTQNTRSLSHLNRMQWFQRAIRYAFSVYATEPGPVRQANSSNLEVMVQDFEHILHAWKKVRPGITQAEVAAKRFREGNLFMPISNGDKLLNEIEATYYIAFLFSSGAMSSRVFDAIVYDMGLCRPGAGMVDETGNPAVEAECFRKAYFENIDIFWANFPELITHYKMLKPAGQKAIRESMERAARTKGKTENPIGPFDMDSFAALPHYLESIITRFDVNNDQMLDKHEVLNRAYPIFKDTLVTLSGRTQDWVLQGALTYVIKFGKMPRTKVEQAHLLAWCAWRPFWKIKADRAALYQVIAILSEPIPKKKSLDDRLLSLYDDATLDASGLATLR